MVGRMLCTAVLLFFTGCSSSCYIYRFEKPKSKCGQPCSLGEYKYDPEIERCVCLEIGPDNG